MKSKDIYNAWKDQRNQIEVGKNFTEEVMNQVYQYEQNKSRPSFDVMRLVDLISAHPLAKVGLVAVGIAAGVVRVGLILYVYLA